MREVKNLAGTSKEKRQTSLPKKNSMHHTNTVRIQYPWLYASIVLFLTVPLFIFFMGYLRLSIGIPLVIIFLGMVIYAVSDCLNDPNGLKLSKGENDIEIPVSYLVGFAVTALVVSFVSGVGEYIFTVQDHDFRRAILRDLIDYDWPVIYDYKTQENPDVQAIFGIASGKRAFSYYFLYWMPAALVGKAFGFGAGNFFLLLWNALGIFLCLIATSVVIRRYTLSVPFFFIFFSGLDLIPYVVHELTGYEDWFWLEGYVPYLSYVCNFRELACVFNQIVPCFLVVALLLMSHNTRSMGLTAGILFGYSPWAVFGIIPIVGTMLFNEKNRADKLSRTLANTFSPVNIASAAFLLLILGSFYSANSAATDYQGFTWTFYDDPLSFIPAYVIFIALEVLPFVLILFSSKKDDALFKASVATLLLIPFYRVTEMNDFAMRASMPALFIFCIYMCGVIADVMDKKNTPVTKKGWLRSAAVMTAVIVMTFPALFNLFIIFGSVLTGDPGNAENIGSFGNIRTSDTKTVETIQEQFFIEDYEDSFFFKYFAK